MQKWRRPLAISLIAGREYRRAGTAARHIIESRLQFYGRMSTQIVELVERFAASVFFKDDTSTLPLDLTHDNVLYQSK
jgi:hypothetical protein